ncbi:hypothetical protein ANO11243_090170 [Dothideomycetidae sp. 11243]|nr:hypothetical protein ANO11243_090170 [fungal sp. No.11243]
MAAASHSIPPVHYFPERQGKVETRRALLVIGLQNDFVSPAGKLPVVNSDSFIANLKRLVPAFRSRGDVFWVRTENENASTDRTTDHGQIFPAAHHLHDLNHNSARYNDPVTTDQLLPGYGNDDHAGLTHITDGQNCELFLTSTAVESVCCDPADPGSLYCFEARELQHPGDVHVVKTHYSAFRDTSLLFALRTRLVTELYIVGCMTDLCVYSTAIDAAQHGYHINVVEDCLGYRSLRNHAGSINHLPEEIGADITTTNTILDRLAPQQAQAHSERLTSPESESFSSPMPDLDDASVRSDDSRNPELYYDMPDMDYSFGSSVEPQLYSQQHEGDGLLDPYKPSVPLSDADQFMVDPTEEKRSPSSCTSGSVDADLSMRLSSLGSALESALKTVSSIPLSLIQRGGVAEAEATTKKRRSTELDDTPFDESIVNSRSQASSIAESPSDGSRKKSKNIASLATFPSKLPGDAIGSGDSSVQYNLMPPNEADQIFFSLLHQTRWQRMSHASGEVPRLVCYQGDIDPKDGSLPLYRHPSDVSVFLMGWSPAVLKVRTEAERLVGHPLNHAFIQLYRGGKDYISEHSDKTLDIVPTSSIVNVSFGAQRTMRLRSKKEQQSSSPQTTAAKGRVTERIHLPHNSILVMGLKTNAEFLHSIQPDRRLAHDLSGPEMAYNGLRISITFRQIGTYLSSDSKLIWGQGAIGKTKEHRRAAISGDQGSGQELLKLFGMENKQTGLTWSDIFGGSDVLNMANTATMPNTPMIFLSGDNAADESVQLAAKNFGIGATVVGAPDLRVDLSRPLKDSKGDLVQNASSKRVVAFIDNNVRHTDTGGMLNILLYLHRTYSVRSGRLPWNKQFARELTFFTRNCFESLRSRDDGVIAQALSHLESDLKQVHLGNPGLESELFFTGPLFGVADCAYFPLLEPLLTSERFSEIYPLLDAWLVRAQEHIESL